MKQKIILLCLCLFCTGRSTYAQWVVSDPTNLAQGIVNSTKQIVEAAKNGHVIVTAAVYRGFNSMLPLASDTQYETFDGEHVEEGLKFLETLKAPYVLKADGLWKNTNRRRGNTERISGSGT